MAIDPNIALQARGFQAIQNPMEQAGQAMTLMGLLQRNKLTEMQLAHLAEQRPMERERLGLQLQELRNQNRVMEAFINARMGGASPAGGAGAAPAPGVATTNPGGQPSLVNFPPEVDMALLHPKLQAWGKEMAQQYRVPEKVREAIQLGYKPGTPAFNNYVGGISSPSGVFSAPDAAGNRTLDPNYPEAQGRIKAAEEAARAQYELVEITVMDKGVRRTIKVPKSQIPQLFGTGSAPSPQPSSGVPVVPREAFPKVSPAEQAQRDAEARTLVANEQAVAAGQPSSLPSSAAVLTPTGSPTTAEDAAGREIGQSDAKRVSTLEEKIPVLNATLRRLDRLEYLTKDDRTYAAAGAELKSQLGSIAQAVGLDVNVSKTANTEEYIAHVAELLKERLSSKDYGAGTGISNVDLVAAGRPLPEVMRTPKGRIQVINALRQDATRALGDAQAARTHFRRENTLRGFTFPSENLPKQTPQTPQSTGERFDKMPDPKKYPNRRIKDESTGKFYRSNGYGWVPE